MGNDKVIGGGVKPFVRGDLFTSQDLDIYVDVSTGSDSTGNGTASNPYATLNKAHENINQTIKPDDTIHIHMAAGTYPQPDAINFNNQGAIYYDGSAAMADYDAGPYTIDTGGFSAVVSYLTGDITVVGGGLTPNDFQGKYALFLTGSRAGILTAIISNTSTDIRIGNYGLSAPADGDTFKIVEPGVEIAVASTLDVYGGRVSAQFGFFGIKVTGGSGKTIRIGGEKPTIRALGSIFDVDVHGYSGQWVGYSNGLPSGSVDASGWLVDWEGSVIATQKVSVDRFAMYYVATLGAPSILVLNKEGLYMEGCFVVEPSDAYGIAVDNTASLSAGGMYFDTPAKIGIKTGVSVCINISTTYVEAASTFLDIGYVNQVDLGNISGNSLTQYVIEVGHGSSVAADDDMSLTGASFDIKWLSGGSGDVDFPVSGAMVEDERGAFVVGTP